MWFPLLVACGGGGEQPKSATPAPSPDAPAADVAPAAPSYDSVDRATFNANAVKVFEPLFWQEDANADGVVDPSEVLVLHGPWDKNRIHYVTADGFTDQFDTAYARIAAGPRPSDDKRTNFLRQELDQGRVTVVHRRLDDPGDRVLAGMLARTSRLLETIYARQRGAADLSPPDDEGKAVLYRNQGPWCEAPKTAKRKKCNAMPDKPPRISGLYPADIQSQPDFCKTLEAAGVMDPFTVVERDEDGKWTQKKYSDAWPEMHQIAQQLREIADSEHLPPDEVPLRTYLLAAATAFETNAWPEADRAWAAMNAVNSRWYLRIGPDETYFEPCKRKAGFAMTLARIDPDAVSWSDKLRPIRSDLEKQMAELAGPPYTAREVEFELPEFVQIVLNAGDSRQALGATIGQSLPNWGPVAEAGGRTIAMSNLFTDEDSLKATRTRADSMLCADTAKDFSPDPAHMRLTTVLHEAAHNLGPSAGHKVDGKTDEEIFGGGLATTLEELKAQTASLFLTRYLASKKEIEADQRYPAHLADLVWALGKVADGMHEPDGSPKAYPQLAAIQVGFLLDHGALVWKDGEKAANGTDTGCLSVDRKALGSGIDALASTVLQIKGSGDKEAADELILKYVDTPAPWKDPIAERWNRLPQASMVYSLHE